FITSQSINKHILTIILKETACKAVSFFSVSAPVLLLFFLSGTHFATAFSHPFFFHHSIFFSISFSFVSFVRLKCAALISLLHELRIRSCKPPPGSHFNTPHTPSLNCRIVKLICASIETTSQ